jgi:hypothetical protein
MASPCRTCHASARTKGTSAPLDGDALWPIIVLAIGIGILLRAVTERPPA